MLGWFPIIDSEKRNDFRGTPSPQKIDEMCYTLTTSSDAGGIGFGTGSITDGACTVSVVVATGRDDAGGGA